jgi:hypothetical protein
LCIGVKIGLSDIKEKRKPRVFENGVVREIFGLNRENYIHNQGLDGLSSPDIVRGLKWGRLGREVRAKFWWANLKKTDKYNNIVMDLKEVGWKGVGGLDSSGSR